MILGILIALITILVGPFAFWLLGHTLYKDSTLKKFPTQINDGIGDTIFLPIFNGVLAELLIGQTISITLLIISLILGLGITALFVHYQKNITTQLDWSKPEQGKINFGGWYHAGFMFIQATAIAYGIILFPASIGLWIGLGGYLLTTVIQVLKEGYV
jgi:hypothetical protein